MPNTPLPKDHKFQNPPKGESHWGLQILMRDKLATLGDFVVAFEARQSKNPNLITQQDGIGYTLLHWAVAHNRSDIFDWLVKQGADTSIKDGLGETPIALQEKLSKLPLWQERVVTSSVSAAARS